MTKGVNYPKGLLAWCNEWGAKTTLNILESLQIRYGDDRYRPSPLLRDLAAQKSGFSLEAPAADAVKGMRHPVVPLNSSGTSASTRTSPAA